MPGEFWDRLTMGHTESTVPSAVDQRIQSREHGAAFESVRRLTDQGRAAAALPLPVQAGTRVSFLGTLGAFLTYDDPPGINAGGEVVTVRSANGDVTSHDGMVFVKWDTGQFCPVHAEHLRSAHDTGRTAQHTVRIDPTNAFGRIPPNVTQIRVASLGDLTSFFKVSNNTLVHKSSKDLWSFDKDADGGLVVKRLFNDNGKPLKG